MRLESTDLKSLDERLARMWAQGLETRALAAGAEQPAAPAHDDRPVAPGAGTPGT
jgi:hypothetical protein